MFYFYIFLIIVLFLVMIFFWVRTIVVLLSMFRKAPYVPIDSELMREVFKHMNISKGDNFVDIGSGDGKVVCWVARQFPEASMYKGVEVSPTLFFFSKFRRLFSSNKERIVFEKRDALKFDYSNFNRVYMYLLSGFIDEIMPILQKQLPKGAEVVSPIFPISENYAKSGDFTVKEIVLRGKIRKVYIWKKK